MRYINVGSGSKGNSTIIYNEHTLIVIDCGLSKKRVEEALRSVSKSFADINALLITHRHSDHTADIKAFRSLDKMMFSGDEGLLDGDFRASNHLIPFQKFLSNSLAIEALPTSHDAPEPMGYLLTDMENGERMLYMTDTGYVPERDLYEAKDCDFYILESNHDPEMLMESDRSNWLKMRILGDKGHLSNEQSSHYLSMMIGPHTKEIAFAHLSEECNTPELALSTFTDVMVAQFGAKPNLIVKALKQREATGGGDLMVGKLS